MRRDVCKAGWIRHYSATTMIHRREPENIRAMLGKGDVLSAQGDLAGALVAYGSILARDPDNIAALLGKGEAFLRIGSPEQAMPFYERVLEIDPKNVQGLLGAAKARLALKRLRYCPEIL